MSSRRERDLREYRDFMPDNTMVIDQDGRTLFVFEKDTEVQIPFSIAVYFDPDENGYCAHVIAPEIEEEWKSIHVGHVFKDGVICLGGENMRAKTSLREAYGKSCLWAEGMAIMITSHLRGEPCEFPFSNNNTPDEVR